MKSSILVVDDDAAIHALVRASLDEDNLSIRSAYSGSEALKAGLSRCPDVVLLDVDMPDIDGFEVCQRMRDDLRSMGAEVIFLSAASTPALKVRGLNLGATDYITKPFDADELRARVLRVLKTKAQMDATRARRVDDFIAHALREKAVTVK